MSGAAHAGFAILAILVVAIVAGVTSHGEVGIGGRIAAFTLVILFTFVVLAVANAIWE